MADALLARGCDLTIVQRGDTGAGLFPGVRRIKTDRLHLAHALPDGTWDAVLDTCGYHPEQIAASNAALRGRVGRYAFVSTISVYRDFSRPDLNEESPVAELRGPMRKVDEPSIPETYGALKALCERELLEVFPDAFIVRPGIIAGPHDYTGRFDHWIKAFAAAPEVTIPREPAAPFQVIDARDLAAWTVDRTLARTTGAYNAVGPREPMTFLDYIETVRAIANPGATIQATGEPEAAGRSRIFPLWVPQDTHGLFQVDATKAYANGLTLRALAETTLDVARALRDG